VSTRVADWLLAYWTHGALLCALVWLVARRLALRPAVRAVLWRVALFAPPLTATVAVTLPAAPALSVTSALRPRLSPRWRSRDVDVQVLQRPDAAARRAVIVRDPLERALSLGVCVVAAAAVAAGGAARLRRRGRDRRALRTRTPLGVHGGARVSAAAGLTTPLALRGGEICVPADDWPTLGAAERGSVLLHELAHVERADPAWLDAARVVAALAWWQPLNRVALRELRRAAELAADDLALARGADPRALVAALAHFAERLDADAPALGAGLGADDSPLVARARRILAAARVPERDASRAALAALVVLVCTALSLAPRLAATDSGAGPRGGEVREVVVRHVVRHVLR